NSIDSTIYIQINAAEVILEILLDVDGRPGATIQDVINGTQIESCRLFTITFFDAIDMSLHHEGYSGELTLVIVWTDTCMTNVIHLKFNPSFIVHNGIGAHSNTPFPFLLLTQLLSQRLRRRWSRLFSLL